MRHSVQKLMVPVGFTLLVLCALPLPSLASYVRLRALDLLVASDLVVIGKIAAITPFTFTVKVEHNIAGDLEDTEVTINRFEDWTCAARWTNYWPGQRVVIFADYMFERAAEADLSSPWFIRGGGGEGEMPIVAEDVIVRRVHLGGASKAQHYTFQDSKAFGQRVELKALVRLVKRLRVCYAVEREREPWSRIAAVKRVCSTQEFEGWKQEPMFAAIASATAKEFKVGPSLP